MTHLLGACLDNLRQNAFLKNLGSQLQRPQGSGAFGIEIGGGYFTASG